MWSSFSFKLLSLNHLRKSTFFIRDTHQWSTTENTYCVTAMPSAPKPALHVKVPASYSSELHLVLSIVATLPQLSWGVHYLEAVAFSDLESGCQSKILVHPDESGKRHEIHNSVRNLPWCWMPYINPCSLGQRTGIWCLLILILIELISGPWF